MNKINGYKIDKVFFETSYPILFTCLNEQDELFLCVCCQNNEKGRKWLATRTTEDNILELLNNKITIRSAFEQPSEKRLSVLEKEKGYSIDECTEDWGSCKSDLPAEGVFLDPEDGEYDDEINYYKQRKEKGIHKQSYTQLLVNALSRLDFDSIIQDIVFDPRSVAIVSKVIEEIGEIKIADIDILNQVHKKVDGWGAYKSYNAISSSQIKDFQKVEVRCYEENDFMFPAA